MASRLVLVLGDLFIPDRAAVSLLEHIIKLLASQTYRTHRTYPTKYASAFDLKYAPSPPFLPVHRQTWDPPLTHITVQEAPRSRKNRPNPLPRQHNQQRNLRVPTGHRTRPTNSQRRLRRRSAEPRPVKGRHTRIPAHRLHAWTHNHTTGRWRQPADCGAADGCGYTAVGRHAQVRGV